MCTGIQGVDVFGNLPKIHLAQHKLSALLRENSPEWSMDAEWGPRVKVQLLPDMVGTIIGKKGANIQRINQESGGSCRISNKTGVSPLSMQMVQFYGTEEQVCAIQWSKPPFFGCFDPKQYSVFRSSTVVPILIESRSYWITTVWIWISELVDPIRLKTPENTGPIYKNSTALSIFCIDMDVSHTYLTCAHLQPGLVDRKLWSVVECLIKKDSSSSSACLDCPAKTGLLDEACARTVLYTLNSEYKHAKTSVLECLRHTHKRLNVWSCWWMMYQTSRVLHPDASQGGRADILGKSHSPFMALSSASFFKIK